MEEIKLDVQLRDEVGSRSIKALHREGKLPAVVYGGNRKPTTIKLNRREYEKIMRHHHGESVVFHINVMEGEKKVRDYSAIVKEEQNNPVTNEVLHIDFKRISLKEEIEVKVSVEAKGEPVGVKKDGGSLDHILWELDIVCLPTNIPQHLEVDVSQLEIGDSVHVSDIVMPPGVKTNHDPEAVVCSVAAPMKEEIPEEEGEEGEPEVIGEKKEGEEAEEGEKGEEKSEEKAEEKKEEETKE